MDLNHSKSILDYEDRVIYLSIQFEVPLFIADILARLFCQRSLTIDIRGAHLLIIDSGPHD